jgi:hypothetical protein
VSLQWESVLNTLPVFLCCCRTVGLVFFTMSLT